MLISLLLGASLACSSKKADKPSGIVRVPAGTFTMGCVRDLDPSCDNTEEPARRIEVPAFAIDRTEVTNQQYGRCVRAGVCSAPPRCGGAKPWNAASEQNVPIRCVDWSDAARYCKWNKGALPTETQWEKAARGPRPRKYPWGDQRPSCKLAVFRDCGPVPTVVGSRPAGASPYGLLDMAGNVSEWVQDTYTPYANPGGSPGSGRIIRDDTYDAWHMRVTTRNYVEPGYRSPTLGFRCAYRAR